MGGDDVDDVHVVVDKTWRPLLLGPCRAGDMGTKTLLRQPLPRLLRL